MAPNATACFSLLPIELQLQIWDLTLLPRVIPLNPEKYDCTPHAFAVPWRTLFPSSRYWHDLRLMETHSAHISVAGTGSHAALQVSHQSRDFVLSRRYRVWKIQNREGRVKTFYWNPAIDIIAFPAKPSPETDVLGNPSPGIHAMNCLKLFAVQYPKETRLSTKVAVFTSLWVYGRLPHGKVPMRRLSDFESMNELVVIVDKEDERSRVLGLISHKQAAVRFGAWNIPQDIEEALPARNSAVSGSVPTTPVVRVVESLEQIVSGQSLQIQLRCNPCEYLGLSSETNNETAHTFN